MPKNVIGGNKAKRSKNSMPQKPKDILYPDKSGFQHYAIMEQFLGHTSSLIVLREVKNPKGQIEYTLEKTHGVIRGKILKKCRPRRGDILLVCSREFSDKCVDIIHKYTDDNVKELKKDKTFPDSFLKLIEVYGAVDTKKTLEEIRDTTELDQIEFDENFEPQPEYSLDFDSQEEDVFADEEEDD